MNDEQKRGLEIGPKVEAIQHFHKKLPDQVAGEHLWVVTSMFRVRPEPNARYIMDTENLLTIEGPGCFWCEQTWSPELARRPCRGHG